MGKKYVYFYFMKENPEKIAQTVPHHVNFWKESNVNDYMGGPFSDRSGGLITFKANNIDEATKVVNKDPFVIENLLLEKWIKEWLAD
jgi:uncharacterized protein YciI